MTNGREKSDTLAKGNSHERNAPRTQSRTSTQSALERVRQAAKKDRKQRFTALLHHVYDIERLRSAYYSLKRDAAAGIDGETWQHYGERLEDNLRDLSQQLRRGAYRASPVRRAYIPKADGRQRPLGVPVLDGPVAGSVDGACGRSMRSLIVWRSSACELRREAVHDDRGFCGTCLFSRGSGRAALY